MRVAIVTGASSGVGQSAAVQLAKRGTGLIVTYHANQSEALDTVATIEKNGGTAVALRLDVGRPDTFPAFSSRSRSAHPDTTCSSPPERPERRVCRTVRLAGPRSCDPLSPYDSARTSHAAVAARRTS